MGPLGSEGGEGGGVPTADRRALVLPTLFLLRHLWLRTEKPQRLQHHVNTTQRSIMIDNDRSPGERNTHRVSSAAVWHLIGHGGMGMMERENDPMNDGGEAESLGILAPPEIGDIIDPAPLKSVEYTLKISSNSRTFIFLSSSWTQTTHQKLRVFSQVSEIHLHRAPITRTEAPPLPWALTEAPPPFLSFFSPDD